MPELTYSTHLFASTRYADSSQCDLIVLVPLCRRHASIPAAYVRDEIKKIIEAADKKESEKRSEAIVIIATR
ncbi:MAG: hypothetical protein LBU32_03075 [Clostridiales bacterium]|jgi:hypothetical protein|nr:hypothetical protein [Clostridiales bacterium]